MYKISTIDFMQLLRCAPKVLKLMKLTFFLLLLSLLQVSASSLAQNITLNQKNISLVKVFREIRSQTGYSSVWSVSGEQNKVVDVAFKNAPLETVLQQVLAPKNLAYSIDKESKAILIFPKQKETIIKPVALADVKGVVVNFLKQPLQAATIKVKNSSITTKTSVDGSFRLTDLPGEAVLIISYIGYATR